MATLSESEEKYRLLFESIEQGYGVAEVLPATAASPVDVRWVEINPAFERLTGLSAAQLRQGATVRQLAIDTEEEWFTHYEQVVRTGQPVQFELYVRRRQAWFDVYAFSLAQVAPRRIGVLFRDSTARRLAQQRQQLAAVLAGQEEERRRIAESLHNGIGQLLYATKLHLDLLAPRLDEPARQRAAELLADAIRQTRAVSHELTPALLTDFGLAVALKTICQQMTAPTRQWHCYVDLEEAPALPVALQQAVYRIVQGLAHNVAQHAQASEATLEVTALPGNWLAVRLDDNGCGFELSTVRPGLGLGTLTSRVALFGGTLHVDTAPGQGTRILLRLPWPEETGSS